VGGTWPGKKNLFLGRLFQANPIFPSRSFPKKKKRREQRVLGGGKNPMGMGRKKTPAGWLTKGGGMNRYRPEEKKNNQDAFHALNQSKG